MWNINSVHFLSVNFFMSEPILKITTFLTYSKFFWQPCILQQYKLNIIPAFYWFWNVYCTKKNPEIWTMIKHYFLNYWLSKCRKMGPLCTLNFKILWEEGKWPQIPYKKSFGPPALNNFQLLLFSFQLLLLIFLKTLIG